MIQRIDQTILAVDDNPDALYALERILAHNGYRVLTAGTAEEALEKAKIGKPSLLLLDVGLPGMNGFELTEKLKRDEDLKYTPIILVSANDALQSIIEGLERGADDYVTKPYKAEELLARLRAALRLKALYGRLERTEHENERLRTEIKASYDFSNIVGESDRMQSVFSLLEKVAAADTPVLVTGQTGSGKELAARAVHYASSRADGPFVAKNCAAINENLLESELFGHVKGAFTGAVKDHKGLFEAASGGTLFLDEIGEMPAGLQAKLLRVLQDGTFMPVGSTSEKRADVRIVAATNRNLQSMMDEGSFREDLYYRLNVVTVELPALKERREDVPLLADHFLKRACERRGLGDRQLSEDVMNALRSYDWRGNVRELENEIERMLIICGDETTISLQHVSPRILSYATSSGQGSSAGGSLKEAVEQVERDMILATLQRLNWNKSNTAKELDMSRSSLIAKIKQYGFEQNVPSGDDSD